MAELREGMLKGGLPYLSLGDGPPLIILPGLRFSNANPTGLRRRFDPEVRLLTPLAQGGFTVYMVNRRPGLGVGTTTMADLAADHARAFEAEFGRPVGILGISTGGSVALQLTADHPDILRRLVIAASAYRLGQIGREVQRRTADFAARGQHRRAFKAGVPTLVESALGQRLVGGLLWLAAPLALGRGWDPSDMIATIDAEDAFNLGNRLGEITAPTLVIGGERDRAYSRELFQETAERIPNSRLIIYESRGHAGTIGDRRFVGDIITFLKAEQPVPR